MPPKYRVLVVEDKKMLCERYAKSLNNAGFIADTAFTRKDAINLILKCTYHVAIIDLGLVDGGDYSNLEGFDVLDTIKDLNEGTIGIVLSGQDKPRIAARSVVDHGAIDYIDKQDLIEGGLDLLINAISEASKKANIRLYGNKDSAIDFLSGFNNTAFFIDKCLTILKPINAYEGLKAFFDEFISDICPIMPLKNSKEFLCFVDQSSLLFGSFWSKSLSKSVNLFICNQDFEITKISSSVGIPFNPENEIKTLSKYNIIGYAMENHEYDRSDYYDKL